MQNKNSRMNETNNDWGSIGIGAMIVFIALILVAAVASAVIIQTGEKLQQNAQQTGSDTQEEIGGKISIITMWVGEQTDCDGDLANGDACVTLVYELAAGSEPMLESQVVWTISCTDNAGTALDTVYGTFDGDIGATPAVAAPNTDGDGNVDDLMNTDTRHVDNSAKLFDANGAAAGLGATGQNDEDILLPGQVYMIDLKTSPDADDLNPAGNAVTGECDPVLNEQHTLTIQVTGGGSTYEKLSYVSVTEGESIV